MQLRVWEGGRTRGIDESLERISPHCPSPPAARQARVNLGTVWTHRLSLCSRLFWIPARVLWFFLLKSHFAAHSRGGLRGELLKSGTMDGDCKGQLHLPRGGIPRVGSGPKMHLHLSSATESLPRKVNSHPSPPVASSVRGDGWLRSKESPCNAGTCNAVDAVSIPGSGRSPEGISPGSPLQYSCLENPMDRGAWRATVHGVARVGHDLATELPPPPPPRWDLPPWAVTMGKTRTGILSRASRSN